MVSTPSTVLIQMILSAGSSAKVPVGLRTICKTVETRQRHTGSSSSSKRANRRWRIGRFTLGPSHYRGRAVGGERRLILTSTPTQKLGEYILINADPIVEYRV
ncbi:hypothetical protein J6590_062350 [Homalodisca vitripennis]|nr:hypothetical protein J6590_062350 [Homalodisca vitripennis]